MAAHRSLVTQRKSILAKAACDKARLEEVVRHREHALDEQPPSPQTLAREAHDAKEK